jgi:WD40 repeat protein
MDFSPDSKRLAFRWEKTVNIYDIKTKTYIMKIDNKKRPVTIEFSPNGNFLLVGNESDQIVVYDLSKDSSTAKIFEAKARVKT